LDEHNRTLLANVHPPDWTNPEPAGRYNLVVLGAGTAGLVAAAGAADLGAKQVHARRRRPDPDRHPERPVPRPGQGQRPGHPLVYRAVLDGEAEGFVKVHLRRGTDRILGATVVARHAGEMISELTLAMVGGLGLRTLARTIHPYPTQAEAIKKVADAYNRMRLTPRVKWLLGKWLTWTR